MYASQAPLIPFFVGMCWTWLAGPGAHIPPGVWCNKRRCAFPCHFLCGCRDTLSGGARAVTCPCSRQRRRSAPLGPSSRGTQQQARRSLTGRLRIMLSPMGQWCHLSAARRSAAPFRTFTRSTSRLCRRTRRLCMARIVRMGARVPGRLLRHCSRLLLPECRCTAAPLLIATGILCRTRHIFMF